MSAERANIAFCLIGDSDLTLFSLSSRERLRRAFRRAEIETELPPGELESGEGSAIVIRASYVFDEALIKGLIEAPGVALRAEDGEVVAAHGEGAENIRAAFALVTELVFGRPEALRYGLAIVTAVALPVSALILTAGLKPFARAVEAAEQNT